MKLDLKQVYSPLWKLFFEIRNSLSEGRLRAPRTCFW